MAYDLIRCQRSTILVVFPSVIVFQTLIWDTLVLAVENPLKLHPFDYIKLKFHLAHFKTCSEAKINPIFANQIPFLCCSS